MNSQQQMITQRGGGKDGAGGWVRELEREQQEPLRGWSSFGMGATSMFERAISNGGKTLLAQAGCGDQRFLFTVFGMKERPEPSAMRAFLEKMAASSPKFRCSLVRLESEDGTVEHAWEEIPGFQIDDIIHPVELPSKDHLHDYIESRLNGMAFFEWQPQWGVDVVTYADSVEGADLVCTCNHTLADGVTFISLLSALGTEGKEASKAQAAAAAPPSSRSSSRSSGIFGWARKMAVSALDLLRAVIRVFIYVMFMPCDGESSLKPRKQPPSVPRRITTASVRLSVGDIKRAARSNGFTVNDVVLGCLADGAQRYMTMKGDRNQPKSLTCRQIIDMRATKGDAVAKFDENSKFGNGGAYIFAPLDLKPTSVKGKVASAHRFMTYLKRSGEASLSLWFKSVLIRLFGAQTLAKILTWWSGNVTFQLSNLRGPPKDLYIAGCRVHEIYNYNNIGSMMTGVSTTVLGYLDDLTVCVLCNSWAISDPEALAGCIKQAFLDFCSGH